MEKLTVKQWIKIVDDAEKREWLIEKIDESFKEKMVEMSVPKMLADEVMRFAWDTKFSTFLEMVMSNLEPKKIKDGDLFDLVDFLEFAFEIDEKRLKMNADNFANDVLKNINLN